jgi:hypothetical protein
VHCLRSILYIDEKGLPSTRSASVQLESFFTVAMALAHSSYGDLETDASAFLAELEPKLLEEDAEVLDNENINVGVTDIGNGMISTIMRHTNLSTDRSLEQTKSERYNDEETLSRVIATPVSKDVKIRIM